jgi:membrane protein CcdC involved in cytochrome C biogenesis
MDVSLVIMWFATQNWKAVLGMGVFFALILIWASRYPSTKEESDRRKAAGEKLGWFK